MKKLQYALLLTCIVAVVGTVPETGAAEKETTVATTGNRVFLTSAEAEAEEKPKVETQTTFRPVLNPLVKEKPNQRVHAKVYPLYNKLARGERCPVAIELTVQSGWHINANPQKPDFLIPTAIAFKSDERVNLRKTLYPKHKTHMVQQETEPYHVYNGKVMIYCLLEIDPRERKDEATLEFAIKYQACNDDRCEKPATIIMKGKLPVADPGDDIKMIYKDKFPKPGSDGGSAP